MKKGIAMSMVLLAVLVFSSAVYAWWGDCGMGCSDTDASVENVKKFQKETLSLRDELITKKLELRDEYNKPARDINRIASIKKEIIDQQAKIQTIAAKYGLHDVVKNERSGHGTRGRGMMGKDMRAGCGCR